LRLASPPIFTVGFISVSKVTRLLSRCGCTYQASFGAYNRFLAPLVTSVSLITKSCSLSMYHVSPGPTMSSIKRALFPTRTLGRVSTGRSVIFPVSVFWHIFQSGIYRPAPTLYRSCSEAVQEIFTTVKTFEGC